MKNVLKEKPTSVNNTGNFAYKMMSCFVVVGMLSGCAGSPAAEGKGIWGVFVPRKKQVEVERNTERNADENSENIYETDPGMAQLSRERAAETQRLIFSDRPWG